MIITNSFFIQIKNFYNFLFYLYYFLDEGFLSYFFKIILFICMIALVCLFFFSWKKLGKIVLIKLVNNIGLWFSVWALLVSGFFFIFRIRHWFKTNVVTLGKKFKYRKVPASQLNFINLVYICTTWKTDVFNNRKLQSIIVSLVIFLISFDVVVALMWYDCYYLTVNGFRVGFDQAILLCLFIFLLILNLLHWFLILTKHEEMLVQEIKLQAVEAQRKLDRENLRKFKIERKRRRAAGLKPKNFESESRSSVKKK